MKIAQIGFGYWGIGVTHVLMRMPEIELAMICDSDVGRLKHAQKVCPTAKCVSDADEVFHSDVEAVLIVTPPDSHYALTKKAIKAGKHVFVEKPLATRLTDAYDLIEISEKKKVVLFVDHVLIYSEPVKYLKSLIDSGELGDILYINSRRVNLGLFQQRVDVIWDLAIHDISVIDYLIGFDIKQVSVFKKRYPEFPNDAIANINLNLKCGTTVSINVSWLSPVKVREMIIGGSNKMVVYDDTVADKISIHDHGVIIKDNLDKDAMYEKMVQYRIGKVTKPKLESKDCLQNSLEHFFECVRTGKEPITGKQSIINTIQALEMISKV